MSERLKIGVVKPDWGASGGFERLLGRLLQHLTDAGHQISNEALPGLIAPRASWNVPDALTHWKHHNEFFRYFALIEDVRRIDLSAYDLVISTQPPTYLADHPNVLALFYHQARIFYDLHDPFLEFGQIDPDLHTKASEIVRATDRQLVGGVQHWLAGSSECVGRLEDFWGIHDRTSILHAPPLADAPEDVPAWDPAGPVVCVSRHEWPKRTEFMVAAAQLLPDRAVELIGGGGQLESITALDRRFTADPELSFVRPSDLWMHQRAPMQTATAGRSTARILGNVSDDRRNASYAAASVVIAPAYREDYGLTALEAMQWQRPLIVCNDGGGLVDIVNDTGAGVIVEPDPRAIVEAIEEITTNPSLSAELISRCRDVPSTYTWDRCHRELDNAIDQAMGQ